MRQFPETLYYGKVFWSKTNMNSQEEFNMVKPLWELHGVDLNNFRAKNFQHHNQLDALDFPDEGDIVDFIL